MTDNALDESTVERLHRFVFGEGAESNFRTRVIETERAIMELEPITPPERRVDHVR